jgi:ABC-type bacteriocin/lantibiotic exporter with double-glycine peptidase domain
VSRPKKNTVNDDPYFDFIKLETILLPMGQEGFYGSMLFWGLLFSPFLLFVLIVLLKRRAENHVVDPVTQKQRRSARLSKKYLSSAKKELGDKENFYNALERALHNYLKAKLSIETAEFSKESISELLQQKNSQAATIADFISILEKCEAARYSPATEVSMQEDFNFTVQTITLLDREI